MYYERFKQPPKPVAIKRKEKKLKLDCLNSAEKEVLALVLAEQYLAAAILTQKYWLKHIDTAKLAFIYEEAIQTKMYKKAVAYCHKRPSRYFNLPFILYELTVNQGPPPWGVGRKSLDIDEAKDPNKISGFAGYFPRII